jgi:hypothetical protein
LFEHTRLRTRLYKFLEPARQKDEETMSGNLAGSPSMNSHAVPESCLNPKLTNDPETCAKTGLIVSIRIMNNKIKYDENNRSKSRSHERSKQACMQGKSKHVDPITHPLIGCFLAAVISPPLPTTTSPTIIAPAALVEAVRRLLSLSVLFANKAEDASERGR